LAAEESMTTNVGLTFEALASAYEVLPDAVLACNADGAIVWGNGEATRLFGATNGDFHGAGLGDFLPGIREHLDQGGFLPAVRGGNIDGSTKLCAADGVQRVVSCRSTRVASADKDGYFVLITLRDVTERSELESRLRSMTVTDELTGLHNRRYFDRMLPCEEERARRYGLSLGVAVMDIDDFKRVNDTWGHQVGDRVLVSAAHAISSACRKIDILCRWGGDEFVLASLVRQNSGMEGPLRRALRAVEDNPVVVGRDTVRVTMTCGATVDGNPGVGRGVFLFEQADQLLLEAKRDGKNKLIIREFLD